MYKQILVPTAKEHSIDLPEELYGVKVEVIVLPLAEEKRSINSVISDPDTFYDKIKLDFSNYHFNRDEANER